MKRIELVPGITSSILGFGCSQILGSVGNFQAREAIHTAIDCGINHFDLARSYGYGEAESFIGKEIRFKRHNLTLASKFGIRTKVYAKLLSPLKPLIRTLLPVKRSITFAANAPTNYQSLSILHFRSRIAITEMKVSLEQSLKALRTDYLDYYMIHDPIEPVVKIEELIALSIRLKEQGKIRAFGLSFYLDNLDLHKNYLHAFDFLQFNKADKKSDYRNLRLLRGASPNIIFSPLKNMELHSSPKIQFQKLITDFPKSIILSSMFNKKHIVSNSAIFS